MMKKISAYTILELITVMIVSTIVIGIAYKAYDIVFTQYRKMKVNYDRIYEMSLLDILLTSDFSNSDYIIKGFNEIKCHHDNKLVIYDLGENLIIRKERLVVDTFYMEPENLVFKHGTDSVTEGNRLIDYFSFESVYNQDLTRFVYRKKYASEFLIKKDELNKPGI